MSVDQVGIVDMMSTDKTTGKVVLTIADHLDWSDSIEHQAILQKKLNAYLAFIESGEIFKKYPDAKGRQVAFKVVFKFKPDKKGVLFLNRARQVIESAGFDLHSELFAESYDN